MHKHAAKLTLILSISTQKQHDTHAEFKYWNIVSPLPFVCQGFLLNRGFM